MNQYITSTASAGAAVVFKKTAGTGIVIKNILLCLLAICFSAGLSGQASDVGQPVEFEMPYGSQISGYSVVESAKFKFELLAEKVTFNSRVEKINIWKINKFLDSNYKTKSIVIHTDKQTYFFYDKGMSFIGDGNASDDPMQWSAIHSVMCDADKLKGYDFNRLARAVDDKSASLLKNLIKLKDVDEIIKMLEVLAQNYENPDAMNQMANLMIKLSGNESDPKEKKDMFIGAMRLLDKATKMGSEEARDNLRSWQAAIREELGTEPYLKTSATEINFPASGGTQEVTVSTNLNPNSYSASKVADWCAISWKDNKTLSLVCDANTGSSRSDYFIVAYEINGTKKNIRVNVIQVAGAARPTAKFDSIRIEHNVSKYSPDYGSVVKGMMIYTTFSVKNMKDMPATLKAIFYERDGEGERLPFEIGEHFHTDSDEDTGTFDWFCPYRNFSKGRYRVQAQLFVTENGKQRRIRVSSSEYFDVGF